MKVREILRIKGSALFTTTPQADLDSVIDIMAAEDVGSLVVMGEGRMVGMLTFREVLKAVAARTSGQTEAKVQDVMIRSPIFATPDMETNDLRSLLVAHHQRYVPVMEGHTLLGVLSFLDVAKAVLEEQTFENRMLKNYIKNWPEGELA